MTHEPTILALAASSRDGSLNAALLDTVLGTLAHMPVTFERIGFTPFEVTPLYSARHELAHGIPPQMKALAERVGAAQGLILVTPEYNHGIPGALKNGIDWMSRVSPTLFAGKPMLIGGASMSPYGAWRGMKSLRATAEFLGALALPYMISVGGVASREDIEARFRLPAARAKIEAALAMFEDQITLQTTRAAALHNTTGS